MSATSGRSRAAALQKHTLRGKLRLGDDEDLRHPHALASPMPILVHITDEKNAAKIWRGGIRVPKEGGVYFMPVLQSHFVSHQMDSRVAASEF